MDNLGSDFQLCRSSACERVHSLAQTLHKALSALVMLPHRQFSSTDAFREAFRELGGIQSLIIDATEREHVRPRDKEERDAALSSGKKTHTIKNTFISTLRRWIFFVILTTQGSMHDYELLKEYLHWYDGQKEWFALLEIFVDLGYIKIGEEFQIEKLRIPFKRKRGKKGESSSSLTEEQKAHNKEVNQTRVFVEHAIGGIKHFNLMTHAYRNRRHGFEDLSVGLCAALHNLSVKLKSD